METRYGYPVELFGQAVEEVAGILRETARNGDRIPYSEVTKKLRAIEELDPHSSAFAAMLGSVSSEEHDAGRPLLSAVAVYKGQLTPGPGFATIARELGFVFEDGDIFWAEEIERVHNYWRDR